MEHTTTQPGMTAITHQPFSKKSTFIIALAVFGVFHVLAGTISLVSAIIPLSNATIMINVAYDFILGALIIASSGAFARGRLLSVWLYAGSILLDSLYNMMVGYPLNYFFMGFGLLIIWQMLKFRNELELS